MQNSSKSKIAFENGKAEAAERNLCTEGSWALGVFSGHIFVKYPAARAALFISVRTTDVPDPGCMPLA